MATPTLRAFLDTRRVTHSNWNITGIGRDIGKYSINDEEYGDFLRLYHHHVFVLGQPVHLLERHSPDASPILIDIDLHYADTAAKPPDRAYTPADVTHFMTQFATALHKFICTEDPLRFYVQTTPAPVRDPTHSRRKDGLHIVCPDIAMHYEDLFALRKYVLENTTALSAFRDIQNTPEDCYDESVIKRNNWFLYGSSKPDRAAYAVTTVFVLEPDGCITEEAPAETSEQLVVGLSIRATELTAYTIRPDVADEWAMWRSLCDKKPKGTAAPKDPPPTDLVKMLDDTESVTSHMSENISKIIRQPGLVWDVVEDTDGYKLTHNSKRCLLVPDVNHSTMKHSWVYVNAHAATMSCYNPCHKSKRLPKPIATALWKMLSGEGPTADEMTERYERLKMAFEKNVFRILDPPGYMVYVSDKWIHYTRAQLIDMNSGVFVDEDKKVRFIDQWLRDDTIRTYARVGYYVDPAECPSNVFNTFEGFKASWIPADCSGDVTPVLDHLRIVANHNDAAYEFILDWMASCLQRPGHLNHICLVVMGTHGSGKDILFQWFGSEIIGKAAFYNTARPQTDLFGAFNATRENRIFYKIEEGNDRSITEENTEQFKNYITDKYASIQHKGKDTTGLCRNYNHFMISSNNSVPFKIHVNERRFFAVRTSNEKIRNSAYFTHLATVVLQDQGVMRSFYDFLMARDISTRDWSNPPETDAMAAWKAECMPVLQAFVDWFKTTTETPCTIRASDLYAKYHEWCAESGEDPLSLRIWGMEMRNIGSVTKVRATAAVTYTVG